MEKMTGYQLLTAETVKELENQVTHLLPHGWIVFGSPVINRTVDGNVYFYQAIVRY